MGHPRLGLKLKHRQSMARSVLLGLFAINSILIITVCVGWASGHAPVSSVLVTSTALVLLFIPAWLVRRGSIRLASWLLSLLLMCAAVATFCQRGVEGTGILAMALAAALAGLLLGKREAMLMCLLGGLAAVGCYHAFSFELVVPSAESDYLIDGLFIGIELIALAALVWLPTRRLQEELHSSRASGDRGYDLLLALSRASQAVQGAQTPKDVYRLVAEEVVPLDIHAVTFILDGDRQRMEMPYLHIDPSVRQKAERLTGLQADGYSFRLKPDGILERAAIHGEIIYRESIREIIAEVIPETLRGVAGMLEKLVGVRTGFVVPLRPAREPFGVLIVTGSRVVESDRPAIRTFADQICTALQTIHSRDALEQAREEADAGNVAKSRFLAGMSHELRTPLNAILGFSKMLDDGALGEINGDQKEILGDILGSSEHLRDLIDDILDLAKIEAGKMVLEVAQVEVDAILARCLGTIRGPADAEGIDLEYRAGDGIEGLSLPADAHMLQQILTKLLSNAAKFTPAGGTITLAAERADDALQISVSDTGAGVPVTALDRVFDPFYQVDRGRQGKTPGTGLGLPLAKQMVELHGGRIWIERLDEGGSRCTFSLPLGGVAPPNA